MKKLLSFLLLAAMLMQLIPAIAPKAEAATYTTADWNALIQNYKRELVGDDSVDWSNPEIQKIIGVTNSSGVTTSGIGYKAVTYWLDLESKPFQF